MKKTLLLVLCSLLMMVIKLHAQNIVGRWQADTAVVNEDAANYQFFDNGAFCFNTSGDADLGRVLKMGGTYTIDHDKIILTPTYYIEETEGYITRVGDKPGARQWAFDDATEVKVQLKKKVKQTLSFKLYDGKSGMVMEIDGDKFYKIQNDPMK